MNLGLTEEQRQITHSVEQLLADASDSARMRRAAFEGGGFDASLWAQLGELGVCAMRIPAEHGGLGLGVTELVLVAEQLGRRLACVPWLESTVIAGTAIAAIGQEGVAARWLPSLASGQQIFTLDTALLPGEPVRVRREGADWRLDGVLPAVPAAMAAHWLLLPSQPQERLLLAVALDAAGVARIPLTSHDATRPVAKVELRGVLIRGDQCLGRGAAVERGLDACRLLSAVVLASEQVGVAQQCLDLTVHYLGQRVQFGRPLASFQALKHRCATMMVAVELARSAVLGAAQGFDEQPQEARALRLATMARSLADDAAQYCAQEAIQLHGGVGFTWEFDPHLYFKRAQAAHSWLATPGELRERMAAMLLDDVLP